MNTITDSNVVSLQSETQSAPMVATSTTAMIYDDALLAKMLGFAELMATSRITIPKHLQGSPGDCLAITMQAMQWGMNPFAVAQKTHIVNGQLGYESQLVVAVINTKAPIVGRINYEWFGDWSKVDGKTCKDDNVGVIVSATFKGEDQPRELRMSMAQVGNVRNSPNWVNDPRQQAAYLAAKKFSRLHCPDVILGVYTDDELVDITPRDITPQKTATSASEGIARLKQRQQSQPEVHPAPDPQPDAKPELTADQWPAVLAAVESGKRTAEYIRGKYALTDAQDNELHALNAG
jgi:hypothetical protein